MNMIWACAVPNHPGRVALRALLPLVAENSDRTWVQFAYEGPFKGHHSGPFEFTPELFQQVLRNFNANPNPTPLNYEHPQYDKDGQPVPAAGWVHELRLKNGDKGVELWGLVEFTKRGASFIREGEYRFCSVVIDFASLDRVSGEDIGAELLEVGLTNVPFLTGMQPIRLSRRHGVRLTKGVGMTDVQLFLEAIKTLGKAATQAEITAWVDAKRKLDAVESGEVEEPEAEELPPAEASDLPPADAPAMSAQPALEASAGARSDAATASSPPAPDGPELPPEAAAQVVDMAALVDMLATAAGVDVPTLVSFLQEKAEAVGAAIGQMLGSEPSGTAAEAVAQAGAQSALTRKLSLADATVARLQTQMAVLVADKAARDEAAAQVVKLARRREAEAEVDAAIASGKALDSERDDLLRVHESDKDWFVRLLSARGQVVPVGPAVTAQPPKSAAPAVTDEELKKDPTYQVFARALSKVRLTPTERHEKIVTAMRELAAKSEPTTN